jgi:hypothetical protein
MDTNHDEMKVAAYRAFFGAFATQANSEAQAQREAYLRASQVSPQPEEDKQEEIEMNSDVPPSTTNGALV